MPPLANLAPQPESPTPEVAKVYTANAANEDYFDGQTCEQTLTQEDTIALFKKRRAVEWMAANRTDGNSQAIYHTELTRILAEQKRYGITEDDYSHYINNVEAVID